MEPLPSPEFNNARIIFDFSLEGIRGTIRTIDISPQATKSRIRMIDCVAFAFHNKLRIWEFAEPPLHEFNGFNDWPMFKYSAISYVWKGNSPLGPIPEPSGYLAVKGAEDADPISIDLLRSTCVASLEEHKIGRWRMLSRAEYMWLDRLCILQTDDEDKAFQIQHMFAVYKCCTQCLILPGGLGRLAPLDEDTAWSTRAWTLQECLAPKYPIVLFPWSLGTGKFVGTLAFKLREVGHGTKCAVAHFKDVARACVSQPMAFTACSLESKLIEWDGEPVLRRVEGGVECNLVKKGVEFDIKIFGKGHPDIFVLGEIRRAFQNRSSVFKSTDTRTCFSSVWRCALVRTSSRPVDMVFSIMGLMGVNLNPKNFQKDDRVGATIALASEIMNNGGSADWLGMPAKIPPCPHLSTFPAFARTEVSGEATIIIDGKPCLMRTLGDWAVTSGLWSTKDMWTWERLYGTMNKEGYLTFRRKACGVVRLASGESELDKELQWPILKSTDNEVWLFKEDMDLDLVEGTKMVAVPLWQFKEQLVINHVEVADAVFSETMLKLMLLREHAPGLFDLVSYFYVTNVDKQIWIPRVEGWKEYVFSVGGPGNYLLDKQATKGL